MHYVLPEELSELQPEGKLRATMCNLFGNLRQPIEDIAKTHETTPKQVISILVEEGLIKEQRRNRADPIKGEDDRLTVHPLESAVRPGLGPILDLRH